MSISRFCKRITDARRGMHARERGRISRVIFERRSFLPNKFPRVIHTSCKLQNRNVSLSPSLSLSIRVSIVYALGYGKAVYSVIKDVNVFRPLWPLLYNCSHRQSVTHGIGMSTHMRRVAGAKVLKLTLNRSCKRYNGADIRVILRYRAIRYVIARTKAET